jgi:hypothetical protein
MIHIVKKKYPEVNTLGDITEAMLGMGWINPDKTVLDEYLPVKGVTGFAQLNAKPTGWGTPQPPAGVARINNGNWDTGDPSKWWTYIYELISKLTAFDVNSVVNSDQSCIDAGLDHNSVKWQEGAGPVKNYHGTPMVVANDKIEVNSNILDSENLPSADQFTIDIPFDSVLLNNLATIFED